MITQPYSRNQPDDGAAMTEASGRASLKADCSRCFALCCVAPAFSRSADFAIDKPAGVACPNLASDFRCSIHDRLPEAGFPGCSAFDCFGAGQAVAQHTYAGADWRLHPESATQMFRVFAAMRALHELLWYLSEAITLASPGALQDQLVGLHRRISDLTRADAGVLEQLDTDAQRAEAVPLLRRTSELARAPLTTRAGPGRDLVGQDLRGADLRGADLRGTLLIGTDLRGAQLQRADMTGADLRAADVRGTDLAHALFLTQFQVNAARGDADTAVPETLDRPSHWLEPKPSRRSRDPKAP